MNDPQRMISEERQVTYYVGLVLIVLGFLLFFSFFFTGLSMMGNSIEGGPSNFHQRFSEHRKQIERDASRTQSAGLRAVFGMLMMIAGGVLTHVGARGLAGSGVVLDPQQAREDLGPYTRMAGGMLKDALDETGIKLEGKSSSSPPETIIKVRCRKCDALNEDNAKFCDQCGAEI